MAHASGAPLTDAEADRLFHRLSGQTLLVAVSGGPDSVALMGLLAGWSTRKASPMPRAATVDHGLRAEAADEARRVHDLAQGLGLRHATLEWRGHKAVRPDQAEARAARYRLLSAEARQVGADALVCAHTLDDQAETVLMRLARGSGLFGLAGMRERTRLGALTLWRPLLTIEKARLVATCQARGWPFVDDPSNRDMRFLRSRWRALMPALAAEGLDAMQLARFARRISLADAAVDAAADAALAGAGYQPLEAGWQIHAGGFAQLPEAVVVRVLERALAAGADDDAPDDGLTPQGHRLKRIEAMAAALIEALHAGRSLRRSLAGQVLSLSPDGRLCARPEGPRRRGRPRAASGRDLGKRHGQA